MLSSGVYELEKEETADSSHFAPQFNTQFNGVHVTQGRLFPFNAHIPIAKDRMQNTDVVKLIIQFQATTPALLMGPRRLEGMEYRHYPLVLPLEDRPLHRTT